MIDDLDTLVATLATAGVVVEWDDNIPGVRRGYVHDPFGNRLELVAAHEPGAEWPDAARSLAVCCASTSHRTSPKRVTCDFSPGCSTMPTWNRSSPRCAPR